MLVGIDDTDSRRGMCTTYLCALIVDELRQKGFSVSMPMLVRLNPAIPFKTRGNGAVSFEVHASSFKSSFKSSFNEEQGDVRCDSEMQARTEATPATTTRTTRTEVTEEKTTAETAETTETAETAESARTGVSDVLEWEKDVRDEVISRMKELAEVEDENTHPGAVFAYECNLSEIYADERRREMLTQFYTRAVKTVLDIDDAMRTISALRLDYFKMKKGRGVIGALAALSFLAARNLGIEHDITYELLAYRKKERWGTPREIDEESVWEAHRRTYPLTWDTVDEENGRIVFAPHSPCPVLFGIRGDSIPAILEARRIIRSEPTEREMIFITNQGTDAHLIRFCTESHELKEYHSYIIEGVVVEPPRNLPGGHVVFTITVTSNSKGTSKFTNSTNSLNASNATTDATESDGKRDVLMEDAVRVECIAYEPTKQFRNVVRGLMVGDEVVVFGSFKKNTINLEKLCVRRLVRYVRRNPRCPSCGKRMESVGKGKGFRCKRCKTYAKERVVERVERSLKEGFYEVPPSARRHISKPLVRTLNSPFS